VPASSEQESHSLASVLESLREEPTDTAFAATPFGRLGIRPATSRRRLAHYQKSHPRRDCVGRFFEQRHSPKSFSLSARLLAMLLALFISPADLVRDVLLGVRPCHVQFSVARAARSMKIVATILFLAARATELDVARANS